MKIVVASDSFKGSLSSYDVAQAATRGIHALYPHCEVIPLRIADGGEGLVEIIVDTLHGKKTTISVSDPLCRPIKAPESFPQTGSYQRYVDAF